MEMVQRYDKCQRFAKVQTNPTTELSPVSLQWQFSQWGVDIIGLMPTGKRNCRFLVVVVDYFTKWAEAEPLVIITTKAIKNFLWKTITTDVRHMAMLTTIIKTRILLTIPIFFFFSEKTM
jgi:hypothetical protein